MLKFLKRLFNSPKIEIQIWLSPDGVRYTYNGNRKDLAYLIACGMAHDKKFRAIISASLVMVEKALPTTEDDFVGETEQVLNLRFSKAIHDAYVAKPRS